MATKKYLNAFLMSLVALVGVLYLTKVQGDLHAHYGAGKLVSYFAWPLLLVGINKLLKIEQRKTGTLFEVYLLMSAFFAFLGFITVLEVIKISAPFQFSMGNWWDAITAGAIGNEGNMKTPLGEIWTNYRVGWFLMMAPIAIKLSDYINNKITKKWEQILLAIILMILPQYISRIIDLPFSLNAAMLGAGLLSITSLINFGSQKWRLLWIGFGAAIVVIAAKISGVYFSYGNSENIFVTIIGLITAIKLIEFLVDFVLLRVKLKQSRISLFSIILVLLVIMTLLANLTIVLN
ncbi:fucose 4-O-acetylase [Leuconostoc pseudomesenteroides]|uniref:fucose 4-O-acetylase n=1 Tax=Leuconostoc pseudomesenteroides TaxID=33968 RepID=UPI0011DD35B9|nr:fucose 4-O-acetylase [Leuconostoc pseudomesenteroides]WAM37942.1 fucose 4-O-acetylase [Leuconostoc pseudomesenteroides]